VVVNDHASAPWGLTATTTAIEKQKNDHASGALQKQSSARQKKHKPHPKTTQPPPEKKQNLLGKTYDEPKHFYSKQYLLYRVERADKKHLATPPRPPPPTLTLIPIKRDHGATQRPHMASTIPHTSDNTLTT
jgi:hypothetical protein